MEVVLSWLLHEILRASPVRAIPRSPVAPRRYGRKWNGARRPHSTQALGLSISGRMLSRQSVERRASAWCACEVALAARAR